jgi:hypothetical protein
LTRFLKKKETTKGIVQANRQSNSQVSFFSQSILSVCMMMMMRTLSDLIGSWLERFLFFWVAAVLLHRFDCIFRFIAPSRAPNHIHQQEHSQRVKQDQMKRRRERDDVRWEKERVF